MQLAIDLPLDPTIITDNAWNDILNRISQDGDRHSLKTSSGEKRALGQIFTPLPMARQLISLINDFSKNDLNYADPGAGAGILSAALLSRHAKESLLPPRSLIAYESDIRLHGQWKSNFSNICDNLGMDSKNCMLSSDFYQDAESILTIGSPLGKEKVSRLITNPPYKKLAANSPISLLLKKHGIHAPNHYAAFMALSVEWLEDNGDLLAIIPRSFFNGAYFKKFRKWLETKVSIEHIVGYASRSNFGKNVLQENICLYLTKKSQNSVIRVSLCDHAEANAKYDLLIPKEKIIGEIWKLPSTPQQLKALTENESQPETLSSLGVTVNTGAVETHRSECPNSSQVKVLYSRDFNANGVITWAETKKPRTYALSRAVHRLPCDGSGFVVVKRITANDGSKHRIIPTWISRKTTGLNEISFDNHIQVFSHMGKPLNEGAGTALLAFLQGEMANLCMNAISGTTQVNINDLNALRYPNIWKKEPA
jgi:adenine-specific DNA-methyltransferase